MYTLTEESKFNRFHGIILFWCVLILIIIDGYDLAVVGLPCRPSWPICKLCSSAGVMAGSALFGTMLGAIFRHIGRSNWPAENDRDLCSAVQRFHRCGRVH
jgi:AAHS family benzoate transporter-like MFS transporter